MKAVEKTIKNAERLLPGIPANDSESDPRWKAIIDIGEYIQTEPQAVWLFIRKWGMNSNEDLRMAIATCLLEHLLENHFKEFFPAIKDACRKSKRFASTFRMCGKFGQTTQLENLKVFNELQSKLI
jgi:hypothetical protein